MIVKFSKEEWGLTFDLDIEKDWPNWCVSHVEHAGFAHRNGVKKGWTIYKVDDLKLGFSTCDDVREKLMNKVAMKITFCKENDVSTPPHFK
jgi:hypothetical protein